MSRREALITDFMETPPPRGALAQVVRELAPGPSGNRRFLLAFVGRHFVVAHKRGEEPFVAPATADGEIDDGAVPVTDDIRPFLQSAARVLSW